MKLWKLCAALSAVLVFGAVGSGSALAAEFHVSAPWTNLEQTGGYGLEITPGEEAPISCARGAVYGTANGTERSPTQEFKPYNIHECFTKYNSSIEWTVNNIVGCRYKLDATAGTVELRACPEGGIRFESAYGIFGPCTLEIPNQSAVSSFSYTNLGFIPNRYYQLNINAMFKGKGGGATPACPFSAEDNFTMKLSQQPTIKPATGEIWIG